MGLNARGWFPPGPVAAGLPLACGRAESAYFYARILFVGSAPWGTPACLPMPPPARKTVAILQSNYIPWKGYFDLINFADEFIFYDEVQYTKNDWRNRNRIKTPQGPTWLTIPVRQTSLEQKINETPVTDPKWAVKHWRTLAQTYARAPHFRTYKDELEALYADPGSELLSVINRRFVAAICNWLGIDTRLSSSEDYEMGEGKTERLVRLVQAVGGTHYLSGPSARDYLQEDQFAQVGVAVEWMDYRGYPEYRQAGPAPFEHAVSVLDLLFNEGPDAPLYMKSFGPTGRASAND